MSTLVSFHKMHGLGNDFVVFDTLRHPLTLTNEQVRFIADRHCGIGCDQLLVIEKSKDPGIDFFYRIFNADGSEVGQCGNGARCLAKYIRAEQLSDKRELRVKTITSEMTLRIKDEDVVEVTMAVPTQVAPFALHDLSGMTVFVGNPHVVFRVNDVNQIRIDEIGRSCNQHPAFPEGVNVGFMQILSQDHIALRVYERGVGETLACGSGACAAVVAGITQRYLNQSVEVALRGGNLKINWASPNDPVLMSGPAVDVFKGQILL